VVVAVGDPEVTDIVTATSSPVPVVACNDALGSLPIAAARNTGARAALHRGAELLVVLDVDCIPSPGLVTRYPAAAASPRHRSALLCGPVTYLAPPGPGGYPATLEHLINSAPGTAVAPRR
jgi:hypothetical protein